MKNIFEVEMKLELNTRNSSYVVVRIIDKSLIIQLTKNSTLAEIPIKNTIEYVRKEDEEGNPRTDLIAFGLKNRRDIDKIEVGQVVELIP